MATTNDNGLIRLEQLANGQEIGQLLDNLAELLNMLESFESSGSNVEYRRVIDPIRESDLTIALQEKVNKLTRFDATHIWKAINDLIAEKLSLTDLQYYRSKHEKITECDLSSTLKKKLGLDKCCGNDGDNTPGDGEGSVIDEETLDKIILAVREELADLLTATLSAYRRKDVAIKEVDLEVPLSEKINKYGIEIGDTSKLDPDLIREAGSSDLVTIVNFLYRRLNSSTPPPPEDEVLDYGHVSEALNPEESEDYGHVSLGIDESKSEDWNQ